MSSFLPGQLHGRWKMGGVKRDASHEQVYLGRYEKHAVARSFFLMVLVVLLVVCELSLPSSRRALAASQGQHMLPAPVRASGLLQSPVYNLNFTNPNGEINVIKAIYVTLGQHVKKGQVLARLDPTLYQRSVDAARHHVVAAERRVYLAWKRFVRGVQFVHALIHEAEVNLASSKNVLRATLEDAEARVDAAEATLRSDQRVLTVAQKQAETQIQAAEAQLAQSIATCRASSTSETLASTSQDTSRNTTQPSNPVNTCIRVAQTQYQQAVAAARTQVVTAQAQVTRDRAALAQALTAARLEVAIAEKQVEDARAHIPVAVFNPDPFIAASELADAEEDLVVATEELRTAKLNLLIATVLIAPHSGVVTAINGTVGGVPGVRVNIAPRGQSSADTGVFIQLVDLSRVDRLWLNVNEADIIRVKVGQKVLFTVKACPHRLFSGTVKAISPNGVDVSGAMTFPVIVRIDRKSTKGVKLYPNMTVMATILTG